MPDDDKKDVRHVALRVVRGGRTQRELEAIEALVNPAHFHLADGLFGRLEHRATLRCAVDLDTDHKTRTD
jgi:hypothetical protein